MVGVRERPWRVYWAGEKIMAAEVYSRFPSAVIKADRALNLNNDIHAEFEKYQGSRPFEVSGDGRYQQASVYWGLRYNIAPRVAAKIGDSIHNLRSALDHCVWALCKFEKSTANVRRIQFPTSKNEEKFREAITSLKLSADSEKFLRSFDAYRGGAGEVLYHLSELSNVDKHRVPLVAAVRARISGVKIITQAGPGEHVQTYDRQDIGTSSTEQKPTHGTSGGRLYVAGGLLAVYEQPRQRADTSDVRAIIDLVLSELPIWQDEGASTQLRRLHLAVMEAISRFEQHGEKIGMRSQLAWSDAFY
jgi:hypothetical protein